MGMRGRHGRISGFCGWVFFVQMLVLEKVQLGVVLVVFMCCISSTMKFTLLSLVSVLLVSCGSYDGMVNAAPVPSMAYSGPGGGGERSVVGRKLVKNGSISLECVDVGKAADGVEGILKRHGGFVENKREGEDVSFDARVPVESLVVSMDELAALGEVTSRRVRVKDVTDEYIDVEAKIKNLRVLRERLRGLYAKAGKVDEMLKIEKELARVQGDLDSLEGRMKAMRKNIAYSELSIEIERKRIPGPVGVLGKGIGWVGKKLWVLN